MDRQKLGTFVLGGVAGAVAGILVAPRSGRELRGSISGRAGEARERGRESYFEARERARERRAGRRERSSRRDEAREMTLGEPLSEEEAPVDEPASRETQEPGRAPLRAVPADSEPGADDELRRRIRQTRARLRRGPGSGGE